MAFAARLNSPCSKCSQPIKIGQYIDWNRHEAKRAYHVDCANPDAAVPATGDNKPTISADNTLDERPADGLMSQFASALKPYFSIDCDAIAKLVHNETDSFQQDMAAQFNEQAIRDIAHKAAIELVPTKITVDNVATGSSVTLENQHEKFPLLLSLIADGMNTYLFGPPGSGKSTAALNAARALGLDYGYISFNPQTPDSRILGFIDAGGTFRDTVFKRIYENGGVFCIDECDNASASLLTALNGAIENGFASFPCGMVARHSQFILVATGNTSGRGANPMFPERRPFDAAFADRFAYIEWLYDVRLERTLTLSANPDALPWFEYIQKLRAHCAEKYPRVLISPRASINGAKRYNKNTFAEMLNMFVFRGIDKGTISSILTAVPLPATATNVQGKKS